jgi:hypothetical protein
MISYQRKFIRIAEYWGAEPAGHPNVDILRFFQQPEPRPGMLSREFYSVQVDLRRNEDELLARMKKNTRYEIKRAELAGNFVCEVSTETESSALSEFCDFYDRFAERKAQPKLNRSWLGRLAESGLLNVSHVRDDGSENSVWHAYHWSSDRATLLYSASSLLDTYPAAVRAGIGRANRLLHWHDMLTFKNQGVATYDFGGWYEKKEDHAKLNINKFKESFGGDIVKTYICEQPLTFKGKLFLTTRRLVLGNAI